MERLANPRISSTASSGAAPGRIAAGAWAPSRATRASATPSISDPPAAAFGRRSTAACTGRTRPIASSSARRSGRSRSRRPTRTSFTWAWARAAFAATCRTATGCTARPTRARAGRTSVSSGRGTSRRSACIPRTRTRRTWPRSGTRTARTPSEACTARATAARPGSASSIGASARARATSRSTRTTRGSCTRPSGRRSNDGGKTFLELSVPHGDHHDLWIDPKDPLRIINGNDGGAVVTFNGGESWSSVYNQPTAEFYHVLTDTQTPYRIYGAQQDNTTMTVPSRSAIAGITAADSFAIGGGESGYIAVRADDPNVVFAGNYQGQLTRYDRRTGQARNIMVWPESSSGEGAGSVKYRMQWTAPTVHSPHDPNILYHTGNHVFRTNDEGTTWEKISPDLTRNDRSKLGPSGGPITKDNTGAEYYCTIFALAESPVERGVLWAGSDDGLLHVSRDDGKTWKNVTPAAIRPFSLVSIIEPSPHDAGTAYVATTRYKHDDFKPYLWRTTNYGRTWTKITNGIRPDDFTRVIREDPTRKGLLYAGSETGVYVSFDDGGRWNRPGGNLPVVPIHDMVVKDSDLVLATHGRSFWVLADLEPIRQLAAEPIKGKARLFAPRPTVRFRTDMGFPQPAKSGKNYRMTGATIVTYRQVEKPTGEKAQVNIDSGQNPPDGVLVSYWLRDKPEGEVALTFMDAKGKQIRQFKSAPPEPKEKEEKALTPEQRRSEELKKSKEPKVAKEAGLNRFAWNMRHPDGARVVDDL